MGTKTQDFLTFYADKGWHIFPCKTRDKTPIVKWQDEATNDLPRLVDWWTEYPDANIGLATGKRSGLFALDVDSRHGGEKTLNDLTNKFGQLPNTPISKTGGGGFHYLFEHTNGHEIRNSAGKLGAGLDTRGDGGYIVVPPSLHPSGKYYEWDRNHAPSHTRLASPPDWLIHLLTAQKEQQFPVSQNGAYVAGQRNTALASLGGTMRRRGMSEEAIFLALNAENLNKCVPPLSEEEIKVIAKSVSRYDPQAAPQLQPRDRVTAEWAFAKTLFEAPEYVQDHLGIQPEQFSVKQLSEWWGEVLEGTGVAQAAANCEILSDLEKYTEWFLPRLDTYADTINRFSLRERAAKLGWKLQKAAEAGDECEIDEAVVEINKNISLQSKHKVTSMPEMAEAIDQKVNIRAANPGKVWGIHYAWNYLSELTGGKQLGEIILLAGEPKIGKSWWASQDALFTAVEHKVPVFIWSGEMGAEQVTRRLYQLLGVNGENMRTGFMNDEDWEKLNEAKAILLNSPIYIDDQPLRLHELKAVLQHEKIEHGIQHFVIDYAYLIDAPGKDEIERTNNVSRTLKNICRELELSGILISSVNKTGMDTEKALKSNVRGSGQQIHDADIIYFLTKFAPLSDDRVKLRFRPNQYDMLSTLHISAGRELNHKLAGGVLHFSRTDGTPKFKAEPQSALDRAGGA